MDSLAASMNPYNLRTRQYFEHPVHAGKLCEAHTVSAAAEARESEAGARLRLEVGVRGDRLCECRFQVYGCPHLIAALEWLCTHFEGKTLGALEQFRVADCMSLLAVPVEKTGRILLLEDAIRSLSDELRSTRLSEPLNQD